MSWSITGMGKRGAVIKEIEKATTTGVRIQFEAAKAFILAELSRIPVNAGINGVDVKAYGHEDGKSRNVNIVIMPVQILDEE